MTTKVLESSFKQSPVGVIPSDWATVQIRDVANVIDSLHRTPSFTEIGYPMVRVADIKTGNLNLSKTLMVTKDVFLEFTKNHLPEKGNIVLSRVGSYGVSSYVDTDDPFCIGQNTVVITSKISSRYLYYILNSPTVRAQIEDGSYGSGYKSLSLRNINELRIPLPSTHEQAAIANALSDVDALILELEKLIVKKQAIKTATMQQLLTGRTRLPPFGFEKSAHHPDGRKKGYKPSELGEIPEDWEVFSVGEICTFVGGAQPEKSTFSLKPLDGYIRLIQIRDYKSDKDAVYIPASLARKTCDEDDIMVGRYGPPIFQILRGLKGAYNVALIKAVPCIKISKEFFYHFIQNEKLFQLMDMLSQRSSGQTGVELPALKAYPIATPSLEEQTAISNVLSDISNEIQSLEHRLNKTRQIKQGMMQELLTGKTRLVKTVGDPTDAH